MQWNKRLKMFVPCNPQLHKPILGSSVVKKEINVDNTREKPGPPCYKCPFTAIPNKEHNKYSKKGILRQGKIQLGTHNQHKIISECVLFLA